MGKELLGVVGMPAARRSKGAAAGLNGEHYTLASPLSTFSSLKA